MSWRIGPRWMSFSERGSVAAISPRSPPGTVDIEVAPLDRVGEHQRDVGQESHVLLGERHQQSISCSRISAPPRRPCPGRGSRAAPPPAATSGSGVRVGVEEPVDHDLLVEGLEELTGGLAPRLALGRLVDRPAADVVHHEESRRRHVRVTTGTPDGGTTSRLRRSAACSALPDGSRALAEASPTGGRTPPPCRSRASGPGRSPPSRRRPRGGRGPARSARARRAAAP